MFHPVDNGGARRTWAEIAADNGRIVHPEMKLHEIIRPTGAPRPDPLLRPVDYTTQWGSLPRHELEVLCEILAAHTAMTDECWCCVWEGYAQLPLVGMPGGPRVAIEQRVYALLEGRLTDIPALSESLGDQSPNVWWPEDRAWCVATEIDFAWTYVGASRAAIDTVLTDPRLEVLPATSNDRVTADGDQRNAEAP